MKHFTIDAENNITVYASREEARNTDAGVFAGELEFACLIGPNNKRLIEIWNSLPGVRPVTKFTSHKTAVQRIWKAVQSLEAATQTATFQPVAAHTPDVATVNALLDNEITAANEAVTPAKAAKVAKPAKAKAAKAVKEPKPAKEPKAASTSKKDQVLALISQKNGATLEEIMTAAGWQKHTVRGFIAILGKKGTTIESTKSEAGARTYKAV